MNKNTKKKNTMWKFQVVQNFSLILWYHLTTGPSLCELVLCLWMVTRVLNKDNEAQRPGSLFRDFPGAHLHYHVCLCFWTFGTMFPLDLTSTLASAVSPPNDVQLKMPLDWWGVKAGQAQKKMLLPFWSFSRLVKGWMVAQATAPTPRPIQRVPSRCLCSR